MHQIISDAAMIREMDADELVDMYEDYVLSMTYYQLQQPKETFTELMLINQQYYQLTNKKLF